MIIEKKYGKDHTNKARRKGTELFEEFRRFLRKNDIHNRESSSGKTFWNLCSFATIHFEKKNELHIWDSRVKKSRYFAVSCFTDVLAVLCDKDFGIIDRKHLTCAVMPLHFYEFEPKQPKSLWERTCTVEMSVLKNRVESVSWCQEWNVDYSRLLA